MFCYELTLDNPSTMCAHGGTLRE